MRWRPGWNDPGAGFVKQALSAWIAQEEERRRLTLEALADVDAGRVIDHQAVQAWADSLDIAILCQLPTDETQMDGKGVIGPDAPLRLISPDQQVGCRQGGPSANAAPGRLMDHPRIGEQLHEFEPREVRRILVGHYEMRYEIRRSDIYILRLWHTREDR